MRTKYSEKTIGMFSELRSELINSLTPVLCTVEESASSEEFMNINEITAMVKTHSKTLLKTTKPDFKQPLPFQCIFYPLSP